MGRLPHDLLNHPNPRSVYVRWRMYHPDHVRKQTRDSMECGSCEQWCECAQRKYGQVLFKASGDCGTPTDKVFYFGNYSIAAMIRSLNDYRDPSGHPSRNAAYDKNHCVVAGRMVESGLGRVFEDHDLVLRPLSLRHALQRDIQLTTPSWASVSCMRTWSSDTVSCSRPCMPRNATSGLLRGRWNGCNPVNV